MLRRSLLLSVALACALAWGQAAPTAEGKSGAPPPKNQQPPRHEPAERQGESSSRDTLIDLSDPNAAPPRSESEETADSSSDVQEMHAYDPHRAAHDIEVGDYLRKRKSYRAAESRYREALDYKPNDAVATYRLAEVLEKMGEVEEARQRYQEYLKILPQGDFAEDAQKALERLKAKKAAPKQASRATSPPARTRP